LEYRIEASLVIPLPFFLLSGDMKAIVNLQLVCLTRMSLTKLILAGKNLIIPGQGEFE
jgi:hypothetical protein